MIMFTDWLKEETLRRTVLLIRVRRKQELELQRFAEFGRVSAGLIHEISTPLTSAAIILDEMESDYHGNELLQQARRNVRQLEKYVAVARNQLKGEQPKADFSLTVAIHEVKDLLNGRAERAGVKLLVNTIGRIRLYGDYVKFQQALANLVSNAIEAYDSTATASKIVRIIVDQQANDAVISVIDNGKGIAKSDLEHIFKPFYSTKSRVDRGIGIGLSVVKQNIEENFDGTVSARSVYGRGTVFTISVPIYKPA